MQKELLQNNPILKLSFDFSLMLIDYCESLHDTKRYIVGNQLLRLGTSIGVNSIEAQNAESKTDFIHKIKAAAKEAEETHYLLLLCDYTQVTPDSQNLFSKLAEVKQVLNKILIAAKRKSPVSYYLSFFIF